MIVPQRTTAEPVPTPSDAPTFEVIFPETGELVHRVHRATAADIEQALTTCAAHGEQWRQTPLQKRMSIMLKVADLIDDESSGWKQRLLVANRAETSVSDWWSALQLDVIVTDGIRKLVSKAEEALAVTVIKEHGSVIEYSREPYGVCLAISPWNTIQPLVMRSIFTPLLGGNTVIMKTSEYTPYSQYLWLELLEEAGLPPGVLCAVHVATEDAPELVKQMIVDSRIRHINFTGSPKVGSVIASLAGQHLKPVLMELGGKAPALMLPDADLAAAATHLLFGAFHVAGQNCMSTERIIAPASLVPELEEQLTRAWKEIPAGNTRGQMSIGAAKRARSLISDAIEQGATDILAESALANGHPEDSVIVRPAIVSPLKRGMRLFFEESFGPVVGIISVDDAGVSTDSVVDRMIALANESEFGLSSSVWSRDFERAKRVASSIHAGAVHINCATPNDPALVPHGGWKSSGFGRFNSVDGLRAFTQTRSIEVPLSSPEALPLHMMGV